MAGFSRVAQCVHPQRLLFLLGGIGGLALTVCDPECRTAKTFRSCKTDFPRGMNMLMEKCPKLSRIYLWVHISGHPEEVEEVIGYGWEIGTQRIVVRVGVAA